MGSSPVLSPHSTNSLEQEPPRMDLLIDIFGDQSGFLPVVTIMGTKRTEHFFEWPKDREKLNRQIDAWYGKQGTNVYFRPILVDHPETDSEITCTPVIVADLDTTSPVLVRPRPHLIVESSPGRFQAYWYKNGDVTELSPMSVKGLVTMDSDLLVRLPGTRNWKYSGNGNGPWTVREVDPSTLDTFESVCSRKDLAGGSFEHLFQANDRWSLARLCVKSGCNVLDVFLVLEAAQAHTGALPVDANRLSIEALYTEALDAVRTGTTPSLLADDEADRQQDCEASSSFVSAYVEWASRCTDSPKQFHVAGALTILSSLLSPHIGLPTSYGELKPNLWFMLLASTTLSRKTTSMSMAVSLAECIEPEVVLATNGSGEGIVTALSDRDGQASLFHRDEISGFLSEASDKKYMSGILETLTRLYDGGKEKRTLRKQVIKVNDPRFLILCGGIKSKTIELLELEHILSGFLPRFLIVCGWTQKEDLRPIGPPVDANNGLRNKLIDHLESLVKRYAPVRRASLNGRRHSHSMSATGAAWERMRKLEDDIHRLAAASPNPDVYSPLYERCMNSIIKSAMLLAADRCHREDIDLVLDTVDIVAALAYSDVWIESMHEVARGIDDKPTKEELKIIKIEETISKSESGLSRGQLMRQFRLSARDMDQIEATLIGRGLIIGTKINAATVYRVTTNET